MRLFIAEKPSLGRAIAENLGASCKKQEGYIICGDDYVSWCFGHILELLAPDEYNPAWKQWTREALPMVPDAWRVKPSLKTKKQLEVIKSLLRKAKSVVHAGDPDREGQLLVDEVLEYYAYKGPVQRIWLASLDTTSVQKALANLNDNQQYANLRDAARARSQADWLVGLNATRAMTLHGRAAGRAEKVLSLGRVQTPTLGLVVERDQTINNFVPVDYFALQASIKHDNGDFIAKFKPTDTQVGLDSEGRLIDGQVAKDLVAKVQGQNGTIVNVTREKKKKNPPLPHCLSSLQKAASAKWSMSAQEVLDTAQALYEKKLTTYPRSDCRYLPEEQFSSAPQILQALAQISDIASVAQGANSTLHSMAWNTKKVTAHHAIIPTGETPKQLNAAESKLYSMIAVAFCLQFYPAQEYEAQKIRVELVETFWEATGRTILVHGWTSTGFDEEDDAKKKDTQALPVVQQDDAVLCTQAESVAKKTTPPSRFTEGTLIEAMANVHKFVADGEAKATLKEHEGIGTEATRASILETLKNRGYLVADKKAIVSTPLGQDIIGLTPTVLKDPVTTAQWESRLSDIENGTYTLQEFMTAQGNVLDSMLSPLLTATPMLVADAHPCPNCGKVMMRRKGAHGFFWGCTGYPECKTTLPDVKGKPGTKEPRAEGQSGEYPPCPECGGTLKRFKSKKGDMLFACFADAKHVTKKPLFWKDDNGKPQF
ncbi:MAG: DNA topoisomerase III [Pseudomonadota bacterium]